MQHPPQVDLGGNFTLGGLAAGEAEALSAELARLDPWVRYVGRSDGLAPFFLCEEALAPRYALRLGEELAGLAVVRINWLRGPYVQFLGFRPAFQRRGLGGRFLEWVEETAKADGQRNVWIMVSDFNANARAFYAAQGYQDVAPVPDAVKDGLTEILLRKRV